MQVERARLLRDLVTAPIALIEAGGGFGKSVLTDQLRRRSETASAVAELERETDDPEQLVGALRRGMRRAGLSDVAAALDGSSADEIEAALAHASEPVLLVVEEVQHAGGAAAEALAGLGRRLDHGHRMVLVGRRLDERLASLRESLDAAHVGATELAFDDDELRLLLAAALGRDPGAQEVTRVQRLTAGWPAASALAAASLGRGELALRPGDSRPIAALLDGLLGGLGGESRRTVAELAHLPLLSEAVATACAGPGAMDRLVEAGLPLRADRPGWLELPDPIREHLATEAELSPVAARRAAAAYADAGELATALALLIEVRDADGVAELLASRRWQELAALELAELRAILTMLPAAALEARPGGLVQVARVAERDVELEYCAELLTRARELASEPRELREIEAELAATRATVDPGDEVEREAQAVLDAAAADETRTRARALTAIARIEAWRGEPAETVKAEGRLAEAATLCRLAGEVEWEARTLIGLGYRVAFARGDLELAVTHLTRALALLPEPGHERATVASFLADVLSYVGRFEEAAAAIGEATEIGRKLGDHRVRAYSGWTGMTLASFRGRRRRGSQRIRTVELNPGDWFEHPTGIEFLAEAALALARTGAATEAAEYAARASERADAAGHPEIAWLADGAVAARWGDPEHGRGAAGALRRLAPAGAARRVADAAASAPMPPPAGRTRRPPPSRPRPTRRRASSAAPTCPPCTSQTSPASSLGLAVEGGSQAAASVAGEHERAHLITLLGGFAVAADGRPLEPPAGRPSMLIKALALADGSLALDEVIELLWPDVDGPTGRRRLRNLLNRVRASCGELVGRDGDALVLAPGTDVDATLFERAAVAAAAADEGARPGLARTALARYAGELLPADRYEAWATAPRERLRRRYLELLDLLAEDAVERGDVDEAIRLLDRAQEAEPLDEDRYLRAAELLLFQGRRGSARALVERASAVREELDLGPSQRLERLRAATAPTERPTSFVDTVGGDARPRAQALGLGIRGPAALGGRPRRRGNRHPRPARLRRRGGGARGAGVDRAARAASATPRGAGADRRRRSP